jgi:hypothetical protein
MILRTLLCCGIAVSPLGGYGASGSPPTGDDGASIPQLIDRLASSDSATRLAAAKRLAALPEAVPSLRLAVTGGPAPIAKAAKPVLRAALQTSTEAYFKGYPVDLFLERLLRVDNDYDAEAYFWVASRFAAAAVATEKKECKTVGWKLTDARMPVNGLDLHLSENVPLVGPGIALTPRVGAALVRLERLTFERRMSFSILTSPDPIAGGSVSGSVVLSGDSITISRADESVIIADGDVTLVRASQCLIVARGRVKCQTLDGCTVIAGGEIEPPKHNRFVAESVERARSADLPQWVRFFEVADAGLEVAKGDDGVKVVAVADGQPPQKAGMRVADVITSTDGTAVKDVEQFRRLLRNAVAKETAKLSIRRDGKEMELTVSYANWSPPPPKPAAK